jgi:MSHA pilin protein MshC
MHALRRRCAGFSLPELIAVLVVAGLLAAFAAARWDQGRGIDELGFQERLVTALRLAQRRAVSDGCEVRVTVAAGGFQLDQRTALCSGAFSLPVAGTAGAGSDLDSAPPAGLSLSSSPATFYYDASGAVRAAPGGALTDVTITVGTRQIQVTGATGHASG